MRGFDPRRPLHHLSRACPRLVTGTGCLPVEAGSIPVTLASLCHRGGIRRPTDRSARQGVGENPTGDSKFMPDTGLITRSQSRRGLINLSVWGRGESRRFRFEPGAGTKFGPLV